MEYPLNIADFVALVAPSTQAVFTHDVLSQYYETFRASRSLLMASEMWIRCMVNSNRIAVVGNSPLSYSWVRPAASTAARSTAASTAAAAGATARPTAASASAPRRFDCAICVLQFDSQAKLEAHKRSERHLQAVQDVRGPDPELMDKYTHLRHALDVGTAELEKAHKIEITPELFNLVGNRNQAAQVEFKVTNNGQTGVIVTCGFAETRSELTLPVKNFTVPAGGSQSVVVRCNPQNIGSVRALLVFNFNATWAAIRKVFLDVHAQFGDPEIEALKPQVPYERPRPVRRARIEDIVPGEPRPIEQDDAVMEFKRPLEPHRIPAEILSLFASMNGRDPIDQEALLREHLIHKRLADRDGNVDLQRNYSVIFPQLLFLEEAQLNEDILRYSLHGQRVDITESRKRAWLTVPGLAEKRPSVQPGDKIYLSRSNESGRRREFEGYVHDIQQTRVLLGFGQLFADQHSKDALYDARFTINRLTLRRMHQALKYPGIELFPNPPVNPRPELVPEVKTFNTRLNTEQLSAVRHIVANTQQDSFYVVFGPPGTGKTTTIIEAMKQILKSNPEARLLCCAPSNEAADLIVQKLHPMEPHEMKRVCAFQRSPIGVPEEVLRYVKVRNHKFVMPPVAQILQARVVVSTCSTASVLEAFGVDPTHFTHIFLDEAGYAFEPEGLIPFAQRSRAARILAGDPKQLGPIVRSPAGKFGLELSLLERMCGLPCYSHNEEFKDTQGYNPRLITKLVRNYRSHPAIIALPSQMFYLDQLIANADQVERSSLCGWKGLPSVQHWESKNVEGETILHLSSSSNNNEPASTTAARSREFPVIFHGVEGKESREGTSPSFFNVSECEVVRDYIQRLQAECKLPAEAFGVVTPYRRQSQKLRTLLRNPAIKVGSVEEFQGQERRVIIMSCVRSSPEFLNYDAKFKLGFLNNPKRLNVSITRAKQLLIVIGNPRLLVTDEKWRQFIEFCKQHHGVTGCALPALGAAERQEEEESLARTLQELTLQEEEDQPEPPGEM